MKRFFIATLLTAASAVATDGFAETKANPNPAMPAVVTDATAAPIEPAAGRNSFTEMQATTKLQDKGYTKISGLTADKNGVWRGKATMKGVKHSVAVDYQGNVTAE